MINAVLSIGCELKASVADTLKASFCVHTAAVATHHIHHTLIDIIADLLGGISLVALMALAVVRSRCVDTVSIDTWITHTLIHINTLPTDILFEAHVAFTAVVCGCGNAASIQTQVSEMFAHVNGLIERDGAYVLVGLWSSSIASKAPAVPSEASSIASVTITIRDAGELVSIVEPIAVAAGKVSVGVALRQTVSLGNTDNTQTPKLIRPPDRAHLRDLPQSPAASRVTAALHLGVLTSQFCSTAAVSQSRETGANALIHTSGAICAGDVASWTGTNVATSSVGAFSSITHTGDGAAFVDIFTFVAGFTLTVAGRTFTFIRSHRVDAVTSGTQTGHCLALIHILAGSSADVGDEASPAGVRLRRALLTGMPPRSADGGAAECFGADNSTELTLAHLVVHLGETRPSPVVSLALRASETIDAGTSVGPDAAPTVLAAIFTHGLSTVAAGVTLWARARVLCTAASIHTPDVTGLNSCSCSTAGRELAT